MRNTEVLLSVIIRHLVVNFPNKHEADLSLAIIAIIPKLVRWGVGIFMYRNLSSIHTYVGMFIRSSKNQNSVMYLYLSSDERPSKSYDFPFLCFCDVKYVGCTVL